MTSPKPKGKLASSKIHDLEPQHPSALRRRISLGFSTFMSVVPLRRTTPQREPFIRATTAPSPTRPLLPQVIGSSQVTERQIPNSQIHLSPLVEPQQPCPYDQTKYHSFSSIERSRCTFCGMRSSRPRSSEPCKDCRSKNPFSHIKLGYKQKPVSANSNELRHSSPEYSPRYSCSSDECPRIVPAEIAAKRIGNPPRRAALPVPRQGAINNVLNPPVGQSRLNSTKRDSDSRHGSAPRSESVRATSPKLHYLHGLPDSKAYPYVHKREVQQHFAAIRSGASSPLADFANTVQQKREQNQSIDFSETVYYGKTPKLALVSDVQKGFPELARRSNVFVEHTLVVDGHVLTERSRSERRCSVIEKSYSSNVPARVSPVRLTQQPRVERALNEGENHSTASTGNKSDENPSSQVKTDLDETLLRLRGGGGDDHAFSPGCGFLFKQLLLTCRRSHREYMTDMSGDDDEPPRIPDAVQIAQTQRRAQGTARLPKHITRGCEAQVTSRTTRASLSNDNTGTTSPSNAEAITPLRRVSFAPTYKPPRPLICRLPTFHRLSVFHPTAQASTRNFPIKPAPLTPKSSSSITPCLRGGAGSTSTLKDDQNLPPTLFWLAGGDRRKTIRTAGWKTHRPKARKGGIVGWAAHGLHAGKAYGNVEGESGGGEEKDVSDLKKEQSEVGNGQNDGVSGGREEKKDEGSSSGGNANGGSNREVMVTKAGAILDPVQEVAEGDGGAGPEKGEEK